MSMRSAAVVFLLSALAFSGAMCGSRTVVAGAGRGSDEEKGVAGDVMENIYRIPMDKLEITVIYNNVVTREGIEGAWGFSCLVKGGEKTILFDTGGDGGIFMKNMERLGIDPASVDYVIISHEHWDHVNGLASFLERNADVTVFAPASFSSGFKARVDKAGAKRVAVRRPLKICEGVYSTGEMGDSIIEQSLVVTTDMGVIVITGCAHPGVVKIARRAREMTDGKLLLVMGGFHMMRDSAAEIGGVVAAFRGLGVEYTGPSHCTGDEAIEAFRKEYRERFVNSGGGETVTAATFAGE